MWLGGTAGLGGEESTTSSYQPHHGTVSWIGRVPDMGNDWAVGVEFVSLFLCFIMRVLVYVLVCVFFVYLCVSVSLYAALNNMVCQALCMEN